jgi:hypothetical protein
MTISAIASTSSKPWLACFRWCRQVSLEIPRTSRVLRDLWFSTTRQTARVSTTLHWPPYRRKGMLLTFRKKCTAGVPLEHSE